MLICVRDAVEELARSALNSRLLPIPNLTTTDPAQVYPLDTLIPEEEFKAIETKAITKAGSDRDRMALLPFGRSRWIESKMRLAIQMPFGAKTNTMYVAEFALDGITPD